MPLRNNNNFMIHDLTFSLCAKRLDKGPFLRQILSLIHRGASLLLILCRDNEIFGHIIPVIKHSKCKYCVWTHLHIHVCTALIGPLPYLAGSQCDAQTCHTATCQLWTSTCNAIPTLGHTLVLLYCRAQHNVRCSLLFRSMKWMTKGLEAGGIRGGEELEAGETSLACGKYPVNPAGTSSGCHDYWCPLWVRLIWNALEVEVHKLMGGVRNFWSRFVCRTLVCGVLRTAQTNMLLLRSSHMTCSDVQA